MTEQSFIRNYNQFAVDMGRLQCVNTPDVSNTSYEMTLVSGAKLFIVDGTGQPTSEDTLSYWESLYPEGRILNLGKRGVDIHRVQFVGGIATDDPHCYPLTLVSGVVFWVYRKEMPLSQFLPMWSAYHDARQNKA